MRKLFDKKTAINEEIIQILFLSSMIFSNWYMDNALLILQKMRKEKTYSLGVKGKECVGKVSLLPIPLPVRLRIFQYQFVRRCLTNLLYQF